jgi:hypothetical protein
MITVWDDLIPEYLSDYFELICLGRSGKQAFIHPTVEFRCQYEPTAETPEYSPLSFVHILKSSTALSKEMANFGMIAQAACARANLTLKDIMVARIFIAPQTHSDLDHYQPHQDSPGPHTVVIYYVNDAEGDTVFFDDNKQIVKRVTPKKGRVVLFDGAVLHAGSPARNQPRCLVNFNLWC